jgi:hypothetical protein
MPFFSFLKGVVRSVKARLGRTEQAPLPATQLRQDPDTLQQGIERWQSGIQTPSFEQSHFSHQAPEQNPAGTHADRPPDEPFEDLMTDIYYANLLRETLEAPAASSESLAEWQRLEQIRTDAIFARQLHAQQPLTQVTQPGQNPHETSPIPSEIEILQELADDVNLAQCLLDSLENPDPFSTSQEAPPMGLDKGKQRVPTSPDAEEARKREFRARFSEELYRTLRDPDTSNKLIIKLDEQGLGITFDGILQTPEDILSNESPSVKSISCTKIYDFITRHPKGKLGNKVPIPVVINENDELTIAPKLQKKLQGALAAGTAKTDMRKANHTSNPKQQLAYLGRVLTGLSNAQDLEKPYGTHIPGDQLFIEASNSLVNLQLPSDSAFTQNEREEFVIDQAAFCNTALKALLLIPKNSATSFENQISRFTKHWLPSDTNGILIRLLQKRASCIRAQKNYDEAAALDCEHAAAHLLRAVGTQQITDRELGEPSTIEYQTGSPFNTRGVGRQ